MCSLSHFSKVITAYFLASLNATVVEKFYKIIISWSFFCHIFYIRHQSEEEDAQVEEVDGKQWIPTLLSKQLSTCTLNKNKGLAKI